MGACSFDTVMWGYKSNEMRKAFQDAVGQATFENGHDPYNGSINTTYLIGESAHSSAQPIAYDNKIYPLINGDYDRIDKGESQGLFVHKKEWKHHGYTDKVEINVSIHTSEIKESQYGTLADNVESAVLAKANEKITKMLNQKSNPLKVKHSGKQLKGEFSTYGIKIECDKEVQPIANTITTEGERETRYFISKVGNDYMQPWDKGYKSQAEARKNLPKSLTSHDEYEIYAITRRANGAGLVSHTSGGLKSTTIKCTVRGKATVYELDEDKNQTGWLFYGWAVC